MKYFDTLLSFRNKLTCKIIHIQIIPSYSVLGYAAKTRVTLEKKAGEMKTKQVCEMFGM